MKAIIIRIDSGLGICAWALALAFIFGAANSSGAQSASTTVQMRYNTGQSIVPVYDGWEFGPDGTVYMVFGYFNRNYAEELIVPIGPDNNFAPDAADRGQPTYFYPRLNRTIFRVQVPKDWGMKPLVWTLSVHGKTEKANGRLLPEWEISPAPAFGGGGGGDEKNQPPSLKVNPVQPVSLPNRLTLVASVTDDGNPPPRPPRRRTVNQGQDAFPTLHKGEGPGVPNVPLPVVPRPLPLGLSVGWILYRGPAKVTFAPSEFQRPNDGKVVCTVTFSQPGTYVLRAIASDSRLQALEQLTVTVTAAITSEKQR